MGSMLGAASPGSEPPLLYRVSGRWWAPLQSVVLSDAAGRDLLLMRRVPWAAGEGFLDAAGSAGAGSVAEAASIALESATMAYVWQLYSFEPLWPAHRASTSDWFGGGRRLHPFGMVRERLSFPGFPQYEMQVSNGSAANEREWREWGGWPLLYRATTSAQQVPLLLKQLVLIRDGATPDPWGTLWLPPFAGDDDVLATYEAEYYLGAEALLVDSSADVHRLSLAKGTSPLLLYAFATAIDMTQRLGKRKLVTRAAPRSLWARRADVQTGGGHGSYGGPSGAASSGP